MIGCLKGDFLLMVISENRMSRSGSFGKFLRLGCNSAHRHPTLVVQARESMRIRFFSLTVVCIALLFVVSPAFAQQGDRGAITGLVTDAAGAVVPNVDVVAIEIQTNAVFKAVTTSAGVYRISALPPGNYRITAGVQGFKTAVVDGVAVAVATVVTANLKLELGATSDSVSVSADATRLESSSSEVGYNISSEDYHEWPISSDDDGQRQIQAFVFNSLPGTSGDSYQGSINGSPQGSQEVYIEGISIGRADIAGDTDEFEPSVDAVNEFRLQTGGLNAAYGGGLTAVANFDIKSGTNQLHGTGYDYLINNDLNANGYDNNAFDNPKAPFKQNSFGGAMGGPVLLPKIYNGKNKSFWFFSYEGDRKRQGQISGYRTLPTAAMKEGDFSELPTHLRSQQHGAECGRHILSHTFSREHHSRFGHQQSFSGYSDAGADSEPGAGGRPPQYAWN